jgi:hypothetical protein
MSTPIDDPRRRWWIVIEYEVWMLQELNKILPTDPILSNLLLRNNITEGVVLHTRNLCDFCTSRRLNDIKPSDLFDNYDTAPRYDTLKELMKRLDQQYGKGKEGDVKWAFNKKLAHPTKERGECFDYTGFLNRVNPVLRDIIGELEALRGRPFVPRV